MPKLKNTISLVTGGGRGIGKATAKLLSAEGSKVIITDLLEEGEQLAKEIDGEFIKLDISEESSWKYLANIIKTTYSKLDILVNNAGIVGLGPDFGPQDPENASLESWQKIHKVNLDSVFLGCKYGIQLMKDHGGSIINLSSRSGMVGVPGAAAYASSKAAIRNHTKSVALYCAEKKYNIRCNSIHPGSVLTEIWDAMIGEEENKRLQTLKAIDETIPLGHMGEPKDIAEAVLFLASPSSKYMTGAEIVVDGGILAGASTKPKLN